VWAFTLQLLLNLTLFRAIAAAVTGKPSSSVDVAKLIQQFSEFSTYGSMLGVGLAYVPFTPCFADAAACWEEVQPVTRVLPALLVVYLLQLSAYVQMLVTERLLRFALGATEPMKADTLIHHGITILLIAGSLAAGPYTPNGALVMLTHDVSTVFLKLARSLQLSGAKRAAVPAFAVFALAFLCSRVIAFGYLGIYRSYVYVRSHGPFGFSTNPLHAAQVLLLLLFLLYALDCFWFVKIVQTIVSKPKQKPT